MHPVHEAARRAAVLFAMMLPAASAAQAESGQTLFETRCARCHTGPSSLKTDPARMAALLRGASVPQHRFTLSETQLKALTGYLQTARPRP